MWLLGIVFFQNIVVTRSQHWNGCTSVRYSANDHINCVPTRRGNQMRCFCQHSQPAAMHLKKWTKANAECRRTYPHGGQLAVDNSQGVHGILVALVGTESADMWIGAKTNTLHWNWLPTLENRERKRMSYQGCYDTAPDGVDADEIHNFSSSFSLPYNCNKYCTSKGKTYMYFTLRQRSSFEWECACYKSSKFNLADHDSGTCSKCNTIDKIDQGWCGSWSHGKSYVAVYLVEAEANFTNWINSHPHPVKFGSRCLLFNDVWESIPCDNSALFTDIVYCAIGSISDCDGNDEWRGHVTGKCFKQLKHSTSMTHREAVELCENQTMSLVSLSSMNIQIDITLIWNQDNITRGRRLWVAATNLRWQWITGTDVYDEYTAWPGKREQFAFEKMCLAIASTGKWTSASCKERKYYICETVVDIKNVTFTTMTPVNTSLPVSANPSSTSAPVYANSSGATTRLVATSAPGSEGHHPSTTAPVYANSSGATTRLVATSAPGSEGHHQSTTDYFDEASNQSQIGVIAGAAVGGLFFLGLLIISAIFLLRRLRHMADAKETKRSISKTMQEQTNTAHQGERDYYNLPNNSTIPSDSPKQNDSTMNVNRILEKSSNLENKTNMDRNLYERISSSSNGIDKNRYSQTIYIVDNDLYNTNDPAERVYNVINEKSEAPKDSTNICRANLAASVLSSDITSGPVNMSLVDNPFYKIMPGIKEENKSTDAIMVENDIYASTEDDISDLNSAYVMRENSIYESSDAAQQP